MPPQKMNSKLNRNELIILVSKIKHAKGSEEEINSWLELLENNVPDPNVSDLIFYDELSEEEIIDKAMGYKPILM